MLNKIKNKYNIKDICQKINLFYNINAKNFKETFSKILSLTEFF